ncbi:hypothetical protein [Tropicimonas sp. S265A]|uniref:hypothetical protein n=1 Tax=Tropicimonas sp. S265A TaxID=3415134 RepID=UPI003C7E7C40
MSDPLLTNSSIEGLRPLGTPPQRSYELITGTVRGQLSEAHAALFAEPVATQFGDRFDWYPAVEGKARPLSALPEEEQDAITARIDALSRDIRAMAQGFSDSDLAEEQRLGEALENALNYPGADWIFVIDTGDGPPQPVLVNWAWVEDKQTTVQGTLKAKDTRTPPKPAPVAPTTVTAAGARAQAAAARRDGPRTIPMWLFWLWWLVLAVLLAAIFWLMVPACGVRTPFLLSNCPTPAEASEDSRRTAELQDQIAALEREIGVLDRACQPDPFDTAQVPPFPARPAPVPQSLPDIDARRERAGAELGDLTFTLAWDNADDIDLYVTCPAGVTVSHLLRAGCNGQIDVDSNVGTPVPQPVENTFFTDPLAGTYTVRVHLYASRTGGADAPFTLQIRAGDRVENLTGIVSGQSREWTFSYVFGGQ